mmetsp:Transcript_58955/g.129149  ORF Transcript_58955/g.129149 Transcript_58955/m.129149 type:complete len:327 (+) Transcript_58955:316-1296(+)
MRSGAGATGATGAPEGGATHLVLDTPAINASKVLAMSCRCCSNGSSVASGSLVSSSSPPASRCSRSICASTRFRAIKSVSSPMPPGPGSGGLTSGSGTSIRPMEMSISSVALRAEEASGASLSGRVELWVVASSSLISTVVSTGLGSASCFSHFRRRAAKRCSIAKRRLESQQRKPRWIIMIIRMLCRKRLEHLKPRNLRCTRMAARRQRRCLQQICRRRADCSRRSALRRASQRLRSRRPRQQRCSRSRAARRKGPACMCQLPKVSRSKRRSLADRRPRKPRKQRCSRTAVSETWQCVLQQRQRTAAISRASLRVGRQTCWESNV